MAKAMGVKEAKRRATSKWYDKRCCQGLWRKGNRLVKRGIWNEPTEGNLAGCNPTFLS